MGARGARDAEGREQEEGIGVTRIECEEKLLDLARQMQAVYKEYQPAGEMLSMTASEELISIGDAFFYGPEPVEDVHGHVFRTVKVTQFRDGQVRRI